MKYLKLFEEHSAKISPDEVEAAAKYFAMSNAAMLEIVQKGNPPYNVDRLYSEADSICREETGASLEAEKKDWLKSIKKGDKYCTEEWNKVRGTYGYE